MVFLSSVLSPVVLSGIQWSPLVSGGIQWSPVLVRGLPWFPMVSHSLPWSPDVSFAAFCNRFYISVPLFISAAKRTSLLFFFV